MKLKLLMTRKREETQKKDDVNDQNSGVLRFGGQLKDRSTASSHLFQQHILAGDCFYLLRLADCIQVFSAFIRSSTVVVSLQGTDPETRSHFNLAFWRGLLLKPAVFFPLYKQQPPRRMPKSMKPGNMK